MLTDTQFKDIHERYVHSGLTIRNFCANEGICEAKFYYWRSKMKRILSGTKGFVPLLLNSPGLPATHNQVQERRVSDRVCFEVCYSNGTSLKVEGSVDLALLRSLIHLQSK